MTEDAGRRFAPRIFRITFPDSSRWSGLEARITDAPSGPLATLLAVAPLAAEVADGSYRAVTQAHRVAAELLIREFAPLIIEWNVDDADGRQVLPDEAAMRGQDFAMVMALFQAWREGRVFVPPSPEGEEEEEEEPDLASIPMTPVPLAPA